MGLYLRGDIYWMAFTVNGRQECRSTGTTDPKLADKVWSKVKTSLVEEKWLDVNKANRFTYDQLKARFLKEWAPRREENTQLMYERAFKHLDPVFTGWKLGGIDADAISTYMSNRLDEEAAPATINRELSTLSKAMTLAVRPWHWMRYNPCGEIQKYNENNIKEMWLDRRQESIILRSAADFVDGHLSDMMLFSIHAGPREHEVLDLRAFQVNLVKRIVSFFETKNHEARTVPLNDTLVAMFERRLKALERDAYVFGDPEGERYPARKVQKDLKVALQRANEEGARIVSYFTFHGCRHTFGSRLGQASKNSRQIGELDGHQVGEGAQALHPFRGGALARRGGRPR